MQTVVVYRQRVVPEAEVRALRERFEVVDDFGYGFLLNAPIGVVKSALSEEKWIIGSLKHYDLAAGEGK
jgi:hypothetical protein